MVFFVSIKNENKIEVVEPVVENNEPKYKYTLDINIENKVDMMAIGNHLLKILSTHDKSISLEKCKRINSNKYKSTESYAIPNKFNLECDNYDITVTQNINYALICEVIDTSVHLTDVTFNKDDSHVVIQSLNYILDIIDRILNKYNLMHYNTQELSDEKIVQQFLLPNFK